MGKSTQKNPPGKSPEKSSKIYTTKILQRISADWPGQILSAGILTIWLRQRVASDCDCAIFFWCDNQGPLNGGGFKRGGFPIWTRPSFFVLFCPFGTFPGIFPICPGTLRGFSRLVLFLFLGLLSAPTRNSPERVRDTIWTVPEKSGKHPGLERPRFSFLQDKTLADMKVFFEIRIIFGALIRKPR